MELYFFLQHKKTKWILGTDDKFSAWNTFKKEAKRFTTKELAESKLSELKLTSEDVDIIKTAFEDRIKKEDKE